MTSVATVARAWDSKLRLLAFLGDGKWHSGELIAAELGISRAAVSKALRKAGEELGLVIESERGRGYRLRGGLELLDARRIGDALTPRARQILDATDGQLHVFPEIDSTNAWLMTQARADAPSGSICLAERQTAGRGRRGRSWVSPFGANVYLSMLRRYPMAPAELGAASLAAGVAVVRALRSLGAADAGLKWPNDVHWRRRKLAGLLLEVAGESQGPSFLVVGVGVNLRLRADQAQYIDQPWVDLAEVLGPELPSRNALVAALISELTEWLTQYGQDAGGLERILDAWRDCDLYRGEPVEMVTGDRRIAGINAGIAEDGAIILQTSAGIRRFHAGEVSLRPAATSS